MKYALEVSNWGTFEAVKDFHSLDLAKTYGLEEFPQNEWRIFNRRSGLIVYQHDPIQAVAQEAAADIERFQRSEQWIAQMAANREAEQRQRQRRRQVEILRREHIRLRGAQSARDRTEERIRRLRNFNFVGQAPAVLNEAVQQDDDDFLAWIAADGEPLSRRQHEPKVNWLQEGF